MGHRLSEPDNWKPPPLNQILGNFDGIYASGVFWRVVSPQLLEGQSRLMSAIALMTEKLKASLDPHDPPLPRSSLRRYAPHINRESVSFSPAPLRFFGTSPSPQEELDSLVTRHRRERRFFAEALKRVQVGSTLNLEPTAANILRVYSQLSASLVFWEDAKSWHGMPWWKEPRLDFPWGPSRPLSEILDHNSLGRPLLSASNDPQRAVTFVRGEKYSSPQAPALTRVPRCSTLSTTTRSEFVGTRALRPRTE